MIINPATVTQNAARVDHSGTSQRYDPATGQTMDLFGE
jgi:hypothetical protein